MINSLTAGGAEKVITIILSALRKQSVHIDLICVEKRLFYKSVSDVNIIYLSKLKGTEHPILKLLLLPLLAFRLKKYIIRNSISIIQSHMNRANYINILSKLFGSRHEVQIVNCGQTGRYKYEGVLGYVNLFLIKNLYNYADRIILKSNGMCEDINSLFKVTTNQTVIYNPYNIFDIKNKSKESIDDFQLKDNKKYLISIGRFNSFKRQDQIIKALSLLRKNVELILIGDGKKKDEHINLTNKLHVKDRVHFLGLKDNPYKYLEKSSIFILSSENGEGFPNVLVEALICGVPVVSTDCYSGPREILAPSTNYHNHISDDIEFGEFGILVPVNRYDLIVKAVNTLLSDNLLYNNYHKVGPKRANSFDVSLIIEKYKSVLRI